MQALVTTIKHYDLRELPIDVRQHAHNKVIAEAVPVLEPHWDKIFQNEDIAVNAAIFVLHAPEMRALRDRLRLGYVRTKETPFGARRGIKGPRLLIIKASPAVSVSICAGKCWCVCTAPVLVATRTPVARLHPS